MPPPKGDLNLKLKIKRIFREVILPLRIVPEAARRIGVGENDPILLQALEQVREKVGRIIDQLQVINSQTIDLRIPGPEFLMVLLQMEYLYFNSLVGEKGTLKYLKRIKEPETRTLARMLHSYGYHDPGDLTPEEKKIHSDSQDQEGAKALQTMKTVLENKPGGEN